MSPLFRRDKKEEPAQVIAGLRSQALSVSPTDLDIHPSAARPNVWGVLMETGYPEAVASLVVFADGSTSLYFSNGGGIIGAGEHRSVRLSGEEFLSAVEQVGQFVPASDTPLPEQGQVRFYIRAFDGI